MKLPKRLYDPKTEAFTDHGHRVAGRISKELGKIISKYLKRGYSAIDLEHLFVRETSLLISMEKLRRQCREAQKR